MCESVPSINTSYLDDKKDDRKCYSALLAFFDEKEEVLESFGN